MKFYRLDGGVGGTVRTDTFIRSRIHEIRVGGSVLTFVRCREPEDVFEDGESVRTPVDKRREGGWRDPVLVN